MKSPQIFLVRLPWHIPFFEKGYTISEKRISHFSRWDVRFFSHLLQLFILGAASTCFTYIMICIYPLAMAARKSVNIIDNQRDIFCQPLFHILGRKLCEWQASAKGYTSFCQGLSMWIIVHDTYCNSQILNCQL